MIKISQIRLIATTITRKFNEQNSILLSNWIAANLNTIELEEDCVLSEDEIFDNFADEDNDNFNKLIKEINKSIESQHLINRLELILEDDGYNLRLNSLGQNTNISIADRIREYIAIIEKQDKMRKGLFYENFCSYFLIDLGLDSEVTKASGDKGIDIKAKYSTKLSSELSHLVFNDSIYLLAQAKFFMKKIDTPVLRKLLGDSILLRFDEFDYVEIAHNAFHLLVFSHKGFTEPALEFASDKKIMTMDSEQIVSMISSSNNPKEWISYRYLKGKVRRLNTNKT